jgi:hypothetical protein
MFCLFIVVALAIGADQTALTSGGRKVILKDNGTWQYAEADRASTTNYDFRKTRWGMTKSDVIKSESSSPVQEADNALAFKGTIIDLIINNAMLMVKKCKAPTDVCSREVMAANGQPS